MAHVCSESRRSWVISSDSFPDLRCIFGGISADPPMHIYFHSFADLNFMGVFLCFV